ncbi:MAG: VacJ family lipoprotein [Rhodocyclaceae bacterium]|jgi:phospholipid-binding lipoprotein MlaA|nr:MAG: VacJ family lipoprotein [Rhodocyclaceae bacterium]
MIRSQASSSNGLKRTTLAIAAAVALSGCAGSNPKDPLEGFNRAMFSFNEGLDKVAIKPVAQAYETAVPLPGRTGVSNFFGNIGDLWIGVNNLLQGKPRDAVSDLGRVLINSTVGIAGLFDVATEMGLEKHEEDFGQTLGRWGVGGGPYFVWPVIGPRTARDTLGFGVDAVADPVGHLSNVPARNSLYGTRLVDTRASLLPAEKAINEASLDKYAYIRDAYLQRRRSLIYDGNAPRLDDDAALDGVPSVAQINPVAAVSQLVLTRVNEAPAREASDR